MCLIVIAWKAHPRYRLVLAGNRDEFHARPSAPLGWWPHKGDVAGGRDLEAGGTWLAVRRDGLVGAVTNVRAPDALRPGGPSRGALVPGFLGSGTAPLEYARAAAGRAELSGFNLLVADGRELAWATNHPGAHAESLAPGVYGLSNHRLDTPWPKVVVSRSALASELAAVEPDREHLFAVLARREPAPDEDLPDTGLDRERERLLSSPFIVSPAYGTRSSSLLMVAHDGSVDFEERRYDPAGRETGRNGLRFSLPAAPTALR